MSISPLTLPLTSPPGRSLPPGRRLVRARRADLPAHEAPPETAQRAAPQTEGFFLRRGDDALLLALCDEPFLALCVRLCAWDVPPPLITMPCLDIPSFPLRSPCLDVALLTHSPCLDTPPPSPLHIQVQAILAAKLKVPAKKLPHRLDETVFDLSGGNPFWVNEICEYLATYGVKVCPSPLVSRPRTHTNPISPVITHTSHQNQVCPSPLIPSLACTQHTRPSRHPIYRATPPTQVRPSPPNPPTPYARPAHFSTALQPLPPSPGRE